MPKPHGHLRERVAPHRREVLVKHSLRRAPLEPVPPDAVREPELLVRARVPQRRGLAEQTQRLRVVLLDALAGLVRAAEARHRLAVARLERQDLAQGAHGVRLAPRKTRGRAFQRVLAARNFDSAGERGGRSFAAANPASASRARRDADESWSCRSRPCSRSLFSAAFSELAASHARGAASNSRSDAASAKRTGCRVRPMFQ